MYIFCRMNTVEALVSNYLRNSEKKVATRADRFRELALLGDHVMKTIKGGRLREILA